MVNYLRAYPSDVQIELDAMRGAHTRFAYLTELYKYHMVATMDAKGDDGYILFHILCELRSYFI